MNRFCQLLMHPLSTVMRTADAEGVTSPVQAG